jgi:hypothetical protein
MLAENVHRVGDEIAPSAAPKVNRGLKSFGSRKSKISKIDPTNDGHVLFKNSDKMPIPCLHPLFALLSLPQGPMHAPLSSIHHSKIIEGSHPRKSTGHKTKYIHPALEQPH